MPSILAIGVLNAELSRRPQSAPAFPAPRHQVSGRKRRRGCQPKRGFGTGAIERDAGCVDLVEHAPVATVERQADQESDAAESKQDSSDSRERGKEAQKRKHYSPRGSADRQQDWRATHTRACPSLEAAAFRMGG